MGEVLFVARSPEGGVGELLAVLREAVERSGRRSVEGEASADAELVVSLGGDGTFLRAATAAHGLGVPVLGVNFGRVGYLLDLSPADAPAALEAALGGEASWEERSVLEVSVNGQRRVAVNELVVEKELPGHMVHIGVTVDGAAWIEYAADGVIVATATGTTGYNLSAGGPVLPPSSSQMVINPVAPHLQLPNALVVEADGIVELENRSRRAAAVVVDGQQVASLEMGGLASVRVHERPLRFHAPERRSYVARLHDVLGEERRLAD